jgi:hypothetical protein
MRAARLISLVAAALLVTACGSSDPGDDDIRPPGELSIIRLAATSPPLWNPVDSFYAKKGVDREVSIFFQDGVGGQGEEYLRLRVDAPTLLERPDGTPFAVGDSILIKVSVVSPDSILFELQPTGLKFDPDVPAELRIHYDHADDDLDDDGDVDTEDDLVEDQLDIWRQEAPGEPFVRVGTAKSEELEEIEAELTGFSRYAIAY